MQALLVLTAIGTLVACKLTNSLWPLAIGGAILTVTLLAKLRPSLPSLAFLKSGWFWAALGAMIIIGVVIWWWSQPSINTRVAGQSAQWYLFWEKPTGYDGYNRHERRREDPATVQLSGDTLIIRQNPGSANETVFSGFREGQSNSFRGDWKQKNNPALQGTFRLTFRPDFGDAVGWETWKGGNGVKVDLRIYQK
ncbi:MAG: hypothetical protein ACOYS2_02115 [Patescibacteria group bacterium]